MVIYHGSEHKIEMPEFGKGKRYNDYGRGFYCTEHAELACEWAVESDRNGYCNAYELDLEGLSIWRLNGSEFSILHWITLLVNNRTFDLQTDFSKEAIAYLNQHFSAPFEEADIIIGYRADDSYFSYASDFLNNIISVQTLSEAMCLGELGEQIVLKSERAFQRLRFIGADVAYAEEWYASKSERDRRARARYQELRQEPWTRGSLYMMSILEQEVPSDDARLRL